MNARRQSVIALNVGNELLGEMQMNELAKQFIEYLDKCEFAAKYKS